MIDPQADAMAGQDQRGSQVATLVAPDAWLGLVGDPVLGTLRPALRLVELAQVDRLIHGLLWYRYGS
jgi:hypothetical protein